MSMSSIDIKWARRHISGFAEMQDSALAVKQSEAEYKKLVPRDDGKRDDDEKQ